MQQIESRIAQISGESPAGANAPALDIQSLSGAPFSSVLRQATGANALPAGLQGTVAPLVPLSPDGQPIRPIEMPGASNYDSIIKDSAAKYGVDANLISAVIETESSGNPKAVSRAGAMGLMQLMPSNVTEAGVSDPFDPMQNIDAGTKQLSGLLNRYNGDLNMALAAYNAGPGAVQRYGGVPPYPETQNYIRKIRGLMGTK
jgi:soluble lytic murein transglycosylase-like protein